jgi:ribosomal 50S subunit-associated protein YjgA (DUF615 family)
MTAMPSTKAQKRKVVAKPASAPSGAGLSTQPDDESDDDDGFVQKKAKKVDKTVHHLQQVEQRLQHLQQTRLGTNPFWQILSQR